MGEVTNIRDILPKTNNEISKTDNNVSVKNSNATKFSMLENFVLSLVDIRYNVVRNVPEIRFKGNYKKEFREVYKEDWIEVDEILFRTLRRLIKLQSILYEKSPADELMMILTHAGIERYNPVKEYLDSVHTSFTYYPVYHGESKVPIDWIWELSKCLVIKNQGKSENWIYDKEKNIYVNESNIRLHLYLRQFLIQTIYCFLDHKPNENLLLFQSAEHGLGKSRFMRKLFPDSLQKYIKEGIPDMSSKEGELDLTRYLLIFIDEFDSLKSDKTSVIKAYLSRRYINVRLPYGTTNTDIPRRTSFIGACNKSDFLYDDEERRVWAFNVSKFHYEACPERDILGIDNINIDYVWAQAYRYYLYNKERAKPYLNKDLEKKMKESNTFFMYTTLEEELVEKHCRKAELDSKGRPLANGVTMGDVVEFIIKENESLSSKLKDSQIRRYLRKHFGEYKSVRTKDGRVVKGWYLTLISNAEIKQRETEIKQLEML